MPEVFLSYSRRDSSYVDELVGVLRAGGREVWIDTAGIRDGEIFPDALRRAIEASDAFVFVITPAAVGSPFCREEVEHAASLNKRIIPLVREPVPDAELPDAIRFRNWIPATADIDPTATVERLAAALDADLDWERAHSRLTMRALEWEQSGRDASFLLRGSDLAAGEAWLTAGAAKDPGPTSLETEYLVSARAAANRRQRNLAGASLTVAVIAVALLIFALISRGDAIDARNAARAQALTSDAERVGALALTEPAPDRSLLLATAALRLQNRFETRSDLLAALQANPGLTHLLRPFSGEIVAIQVTPDGRRLAVADDAGGLRFIDLASLRPIGPLIRLGASVAPRAMAFAPDGRTLAVMTADPGQAALVTIDPQTGTIHRLATWPGPVPAPPRGSAGVAYSPDGRWLAASTVRLQIGTGEPTGARLGLFSAATGRRRWERGVPLSPGEQEPHVAFASPNVLLTSAQQGDTLLWDARTGTVRRRYPVGGLPAVAAGGRTVALGANSPSAATPSAAVVMLDLRSGRARTLASQLPSAWIRGVAITPGGDRVVAGAFDGVHVWDTATGAIVETFPSEPGPRSVVSLDPRGTTVFAGYQDGSVATFDLSGSRRLGQAFRWNVPTRSCGQSPCAAIDPRSDVMATDQADGTIALVDLHTLRLVRTLPARNGPIANAVTFSPDGRTLITGGINRTVTLWDRATGHLMRSIGLPDPVWWTAISPDARLLAVQTQTSTSPDSHVLLLRLDTGQIEHAQLVRHGIGGVQFTGDGRTLVALGCCAGGSTVAAWDVATGRQLFTRNAGSAATTFALRPSARELAVGTEDGHVLLLDPRTGRTVAPPLQVAAANVADLAFSPDGSAFAASAVDGTTSLWDIRLRKRIGNPFAGSVGAIPDVAYAAGGRLVLILDSNAVMWPTDAGSWRRFACQVAGRDLAPAEWRDLLPGRAYRHVCPPSSA